MKDSGNQSGLLMPKYALYIWGIVLSPLAAGVFLALNIINSHRINRAIVAKALVPFAFGMLNVLILVKPYLFIYNWFVSNVLLSPFRLLGLDTRSEFSIFIIQVAYTIILVEWNWKKFLS